MQLPCEIAVKSLIPSIRSAIARELTQKYRFKQKDIAYLLGITQTAVSKYTTGARGTVIKIENFEDVQTTITEIADLLANNQLTKYELLEKLCKTCNIIKQKRVMCKLCKRTDPLIEIKKCFICLN